MVIIACHNGALDVLIAQTILSCLLDPMKFIFEQNTVTRGDMRHILGSSINLQLNSWSSSKIRHSMLR